MINKGENTVICDECKQSITLEIQKAYKRGGIVFQFLRCEHCGTKTLIDVTDQATREKQIEYAKLASINQNIRDLFESHDKKVTEKQFIDNVDKMEQLLKEIKEAKAALKAKYEGEL